MYKVLICDKLSEEGIKILENAGIEADCRFGVDRDELKEIIKNYDAVIVRSQTKIDAEIIEEAKRLKFIGRAGVGVDNIDVEKATKKGIIVMNAPGANTISTCEHTFALLLSLARKIPSANNSLKRREWNRSQFKGTELYGKILGIIGLGRIGKEVTKRAISFGMKVLAYDPFISAEVAESIGAKLVELDELLKNSDFVTVHTPLTEETKNLITFEKIEMMKETAFIINCARGGIINEDDLYKALKEKKIAGVALDVFQEEPPFNSPLLNLDNVVVTPHLGATTYEAQINVAKEIATCVCDALLGKAIKNAVNYIQVDPEIYRILKPYMELTQSMGKFISQLIEGRTSSVKLRYYGEIASLKVDPLSMSFMRGYLSQILEEEEVNLVNALQIAKERGIRVEQVKNPQEEEYVNLVKVEIVTDKQKRILEGTLFSNKEPRFVKLDDFHIEITPSAYMLIIFNWDKPGVVGMLGTLLGKEGINIAGMSLGRRAPQDVALTVLNIDSLVSQEILREIKNTSNVIFVKLVKL